MAEVTATAPLPRVYAMRSGDLVDVVARTGTRTNRVLTLTREETEFLMNDLKSAVKHWPTPG